jgi:CRISPR/Cas system-associated protein Cas10 (large subunit of type III CRISPR-Cas system)
MSHQYLVSFDTDRIKEYVFATDKLREVRGASSLLTHLNESLTDASLKQISPNCALVFSGGGSAAVLAPSEAEAQRVIATVEALYREKTFTASITGVYVPLPLATETSDFGKLMEIASLKLRQAKDEKARRTMAMIEPYLQPCAACERYPAVQVSAIDRQPICESCLAKRKAFADYREITPNAPEDLNALGGVARPPDYIGFIYADGNNMGTLLGKMERSQNYQTLAEGLQRLVADSVRTSLQKHSFRNGIQPYETLLVGGDDLIIVTAGDIALSMALDIANYFESTSPKILREVGLSAGKLTMGVGVVVAHASFPIAAFRRLAEQLLKKAKRRCAEEKYETSALDFMVVTAAGSSDVNTLREEVLSQEVFVFPHGDRRVRLTRRPYTLSEAQNLLGHLRKFKEESFPRSQLQFLYEGLFHSQLEAVYRWGKVAGRVKKEHRQLMDDFNREFGNGVNGLPPWHKGEDTDEYTSALGDLIEIYPFVQP